MSSILVVQLSFYLFRVASDRRFSIDLLSLRCRLFRPVSRTPMSDEVNATDIANAPLSSSFAPSSWSSNLGVTEALASYRRSQYIITGQNVASSSVDTDEQRDELDEESQYEGYDEEASRAPSEEPEEAPFLDDFEQDDGWHGLVRGSVGQRPQAPDLSRRTTETFRPSPSDKTPVARSPLLSGSLGGERTPLLHKAPSSTSVLQLPRRRREENVVEALSSPSGAQPAHRPSQGSLGQKARLQRKLSAASTRSAKVPRGRSTFGQTVRESSYTL